MVRTAAAIFLLLPLLAWADKPGYPGIWGIWGSPLSREGRPWYKGRVVTVGWEEIEPSDNRFVWEPLDKLINDAASKDLDVMVMVYTGERSPAWLYQHGVPAVKTDFAGYSQRAGKGETTFPYYLDGKFRDYFKRMIRAVAARLDTGLPASVRRRIIVGQCPAGASGGPHPYKVAGDPGSGRGTWALEYDAVGGKRRTAVSVRKSGSGVWKEAAATVRDGYFGNRCPHGTDLMLVNTDAEDDTFHMIEVARRTGDRKGYWEEGQ